jgi:isopenicillin-N N-acyltransferase-like protein
MEEGMQSSIPILHLKGLPQEVGEKHGEEFKDSIRELFDLLCQNFLAYAPVKFSKGSLVDLNMKNAAFGQEYAPDIMQEMLGIARGAGVPFQSIFFLNSAFNLINFGDIRATIPLLGCTSFGVTSEATAHGRVCIGQNYDAFKFLERYPVVLKIENGLNPCALVYTTAGVVANAGMNQCGLGVNVNYLCASDVGFGVLTSIIIRKILQAERFGDAIGAVLSVKRASGANYVIGDATGGVVNIETSSKDYEILYPTDGIITHSNHFISPHMRCYQIDRPNMIGDSIARNYRTRELLRKQTGKIEDSLLMKIMQDHANFPSSICFHGRRQEANADGDVCTVASMVQNLGELSMHLSKGVPCKVGYTSFSIK